MQPYDVIIIGAGHNGLVCAAYLGMAGLKVKVYERRGIVGGAAVTEEIFPGFRNSTAAYTVSLLHPRVIRDLDLFAHGLRIVEQRAQKLPTPLPDGRYLLAAEGRTEAHLAKFSAFRCPAPAKFQSGDRRGCRLVAPADPGGSPNLSLGLSVKSARELLRLGGFANRLRRLSTETLNTVFDLFTKSAGDYLDGWFESDPIKALFGFDAIVGNYASPYAPGSAYVLLHHAMGEVNGKKRSWGHAVGGMGAITQAMARFARTAGVEIETEAPVREVLVEKNGATGVVLANGARIHSKAVAANVNLKLLYTSMLPAGAVDAPFLHRMRNWRCASGTFRMNLALSELPSFIACPATTCRITTRPESSWGRACSTWSVPTAMRGRWAGAGRRSSSWSLRLPLTTRSPRAERMWRACSASMSRHSCPTELHGMTAARRLPT